MNLQFKRKEFTDKLRKAQKEEYFKKVRMTLLSEEQKNSKAKIQFNASGQQEILESIQSFRNEGQMLDFSAINDYIIGFQG